MNDFFFLCNFSVICCAICLLIAVQYVCDLLCTFSGEFVRGLLWNMSIVDHELMIAALPGNYVMRSS